MIFFKHISTRCHLLLVSQLQTRLNLDRRGDRGGRCHDVNTQGLPKQICSAYCVKKVILCNFVRLFNKLVKWIKVMVTC